MSEPVKLKMFRIDRRRARVSPGGRKIYPSPKSSRGEWGLHTPIGDIVLRHRDGWWTARAMGKLTSLTSDGVDYLSLSLWLQYTGVARAHTETRAELVRVISQALQRWPETPEELLDQRYGRRAN